jgi:hypothetical protein
MADHDEFDASELASAYLDGEVSDAERARVESDAALGAEVARLRRVRAALGEAPTAPPASREAAIAAALATFDAEHAVEGPNVVGLDRRRRARWMQGITAAAAVALIAVGGFVIANRDDDEATTAREQASQSTTPPAAGGVALETQTSSAPAAPAAAPTTTVAAPGEDTSAESEQDDVQIAAAAPTTGPAANVLSEAASGRPVISDPAQLAELAASLDPPPRPLDAVLADCRAGELDGEPDATVRTAAAAETAVVIATGADGPVAVSTADCSIVMRSPTGPANTDS